MKNPLVVVLMLITSIISAQVKFEAKSDNIYLKDKVFIITELDKTEFLTTDLIVVKYKLFVSHDVGIENWKEAQKPSYNDFEMNNSKLENMNIAYETYNDEKYRTVVFKEVILKPNRKGNLVLPKYALDVVASIPSKTDKNSYGRFKQEKQNITITTKEITLKVK